MASYEEQPGGGTCLSNGLPTSDGEMSTSSPNATQDNTASSLLQNGGASVLNTDVAAGVSRSVLPDDDGILVETPSDNVYISQISSSLKKSRRKGQGNDMQSLYFEGCDCASGRACVSAGPDTANTSGAKPHHVPGRHYHCRSEGCVFITGYFGSVIRHEAMRHKIVKPGMTVFQCQLCDSLTIQLSEYARHLEKHVRDEAGKPGAQQFACEEYAKCHELGVQVKPVLAKKLNLQQNIETKRKTTTTSETAKKLLKGVIKSQKLTEKYRSKQKITQRLPHVMKYVSRLKNNRALKNNTGILASDLPREDHYRFEILKDGSSRRQKIPREQILRERPAIKIGPKGMYHCPKCPFKTNVQCSILRHRVALHDLPPVCSTYYCYMCSTYTTNGFDFRRHCSQLAHKQKLSELGFGIDHVHDFPDADATNALDQGKPDTPEMVEKGLLKPKHVKQERKSISSKKRRLSKPRPVKVERKTVSPEKHDQASLKPLNKKHLTSEHTIFEIMEDGSIRCVDIASADTSANNDSKSGSYCCTVCGYRTAKCDSFLLHLVNEHNFTAGTETYCCRPCGEWSVSQTKFKEHCQSQSHSSKIGERSDKNSVAPSGLDLLSKEAPSQQTNSKKTKLQTNVGSNVPGKKFLKICLSKQDVLCITVMETDLQKNAEPIPQKEGQMSCPRCEYTSSFPYSMKNHMYSKHDLPVVDHMYVCKLCSFRTTLWLQFSDHLKTKGHKQKCEVNGLAAYEHLHDQFAHERNKLRRHSINHTPVSGKETTQSKAAVEDDSTEEAVSKPQVYIDRCEEQNGSVEDSNIEEVVSRPQVYLDRDEEPTDVRVSIGNVSPSSMEDVITEEVVNRPQVYLDRDEESTDHIRNLSHDKSCKSVCQNSSTEVTIAEEVASRPQIYIDRDEESTDVQISTGNLSNDKSCKPSCQSSSMRDAFTEEATNRPQVYLDGNEEPVDLQDLKMDHGSRTTEIIPEGNPHMCTEQQAGNMQHDDAKSDTALDCDVCDRVEAIKDEPCTVEDSLGEIAILDTTSVSLDFHNKLSSSGVITLCDVEEDIVTPSTDNSFSEEPASINENRKRKQRSGSDSDDCVIICDEDEAENSETNKESIAEDHLKSPDSGGTNPTSKERTKRCSSTVRNLVQGTFHPMDLEQVASAELLTELHVRQQLFSCLCGAMFVNLNLYRIHMKCHTPGKALTCAVCGVTSVNWRAFAKHLIRH